MTSYYLDTLGAVLVLSGSHRFFGTATTRNRCSCGSVVEHCVSSAKDVGSIPGNTHTDEKKICTALNALQVALDKSIC